MKNNKWLILILLAFTWGSSFILIKKGLEGGLKPIQIGTIRIISASFILLLLGFKSIKKIPSYKWKYVALAGLLGNSLPIFLFAFAQTEISSSISSTINSLTPLNTMIIGASLLGVTFNRNQKLGILMGFLGCMFLIYSGASENPSKNYWYAILVFLASVCYGININLVKKYLQDVPPISVVVGSFSIFLIPAVFVLHFSDFDFNYISKEHLLPILSIITLGIIGTGIANIYFYKLIHISSPLFASSVTYLIPVVATIFGVIDHESVNLMQIVGTSVILCGVYVSNMK